MRHLILYLPEKQMNRTYNAVDEHIHILFKDGSSKRYFRC